MSCCNTQQMEYLVLHVSMSAEGQLPSGSKVDSDKFTLMETRK